MKYLSLFFILMCSVSARADFCDPTWWENIAHDQLQEYVMESDNFFALNNTCDDGNKPIYLAAMAGLPLDSISYLFIKSAEFYVAHILTRTNNANQSLSSLIVNESEIINFRANVSIDLIDINPGSSRSDKAVSIDEGIVRNVCNFNWWENAIRNEDGLIMYLIGDQSISILYDACADGNMPMHLAVQAGLSLDIVRYFFWRGIIIHTYNTLDQKNNQGRTLSDLLVVKDHQVPFAHIEFSMSIGNNPYASLLEAPSPKEEDDFGPVDPDFDTDFFDPVIPQR